MPRRLDPEPTVSCERSTRRRFCVFGERLQRLPPYFHARARIQPRNLENPRPAIGPVVAQERTLRVPAADLFNAVRLSPQARQRVGDIRSIRSDRNDRIGPVEHLPERPAVRRLADHDGARRRSFVVAEAHLDLPLCFVRYVHLARSDGEETTSLCRIRVEIAMLPV